MTQKALDHAAALHAGYLYRIWHSFTHHRLLLIAPILILLLAGSARAQLSLNSEQTKSILAPIKTLEHKQKAKVGIEIRNAMSGELILAHRAQEDFKPASLAKLFSTATALRLLGPEYRYRSLATSNGKLSWGKLQGDLIIKGSGDPSLASNYLLQDSARFMQSLLEMVAYYGIEEIEGDIVVDASAFEAKGVVDSWLDEDKGNYYGAGVYGFNINDNRIDLILRSRGAGSRSEIRAVFPPHPELKWENKIMSARRGDTASSYGVGTEPKRLLTGVIPANRSRYRLRTDLPNPMLYTAQLLERTLSEKGVQIKGIARYSFEPVASSKELLIYESMPLDTLIRVCNVRSLNHFAEAFLKSIASFSPSSPKHGLSSKDGLAVMREYWKKEAGILDSDLRLADGSGLSRASTLKPVALSRLLVAMQTAEDKKGEIFLKSLPQAGKEGTVRGFMKDSDLELYLKSGSMKGIQGYAGYLLHEGEIYTVVLIGNELTNKTALRQAWENLLRAVFQSSE